MDSPVFRQVETIGAKAIAGLKAVVLLSIASLAVEGWNLVVLDASFLTEELHAVEVAQFLVGVLMAIACVYTTICFCRWMHRSYRNLEPLGVQQPRYTPGWAVASFFIPILNLWRPYRAIKDIWNGSVGHELTRPEPQVACWWAAWIVTMVTDDFSSYAELNAETVEHLQYASAFVIVADFAAIIAAFYAVRVIQGAVDRQMGRAAHLELAVSA